MRPVEILPALKLRSEYPGTSIPLTTRGNTTLRALHKSFGSEVPANLSPEQVQCCSERSEIGS